MSSASPQTNTQPLWFCGVKAGSQLIRYSFSWLLRVPLSVTLLTHTAVRLSQPSFIPYIQLRRPDTVCSSVLYICVAPWRHVEFSRWFWSENSAASVCERPHELTTDNPELKWIRKGLQRTWIMGHMARSLFIRGFSFGASGGFDFLFDPSRGARLICRGSVAGDGGGAGVTPEWQQVKSLISKIRSALLCLTSNKLGLTIKAH